MKILGGLAVLSLNLQDLLIKCWCWVGQDSIKYWEWLSHYYFATTSLTKYKKHFWKFLNGLDTDLDCLVFYHKIPLSHHSEKCAFTIASNLPNLCICRWYVFTLSQKNIVYINIACFLFKKLRTVLVQESQIVWDVKTYPWGHSEESWESCPYESWEVAMAQNKLGMVVMENGGQMMKKMKIKMMMMMVMMMIIIIIMIHDYDYIIMMMTTLISQRRRWRQRQWRPTFVLLLDNRMSQQEA